MITTTIKGLPEFEGKGILIEADRRGHEILMLLGDDFKAKDRIIVGLASMLYESNAFNELEPPYQVTELDPADPKHKEMKKSFDEVRGLMVPEPPPVPPKRLLSEDVRPWFTRGWPPWV
jgi:hypothetical protein